MISGMLGCGDRRKNFYGEFTHADVHEIWRIWVRTRTLLIGVGLAHAVEAKRARLMMIWENQHASVLLTIDMCHDIPYLSFSQPHLCVSAPSESFSHSSSTCSCVLQFTKNDMAGEKVNRRPHFAPHEHANVMRDG